MTILRLMAALQDKPFRPFVMNLVDGRTLTVTHPECVTFFENERSFTFANAEDRTHIVDSTHVIDIEYPSLSERRF